MATIAVFVALGGSAVALDVVPFAKKAGYAKKAGKAQSAGKAARAGKVDGFDASATPKPGRLLALDAAGKLPASVGAVGEAGPAGPAGAEGPPGPEGPKGETGTVDTSSFFTKDESDGRFLGKTATAVDADQLDGLASTSFLRSITGAGGVLTGTFSSLAF